MTDTFSLAFGSLSEIGSAMSRPIVGMEEEPSSLERLCMKARAAVDAAAHPERPSLLDGSFIGTALVPMVLLRESCEMAVLSC